MIEATFLVLSWLGIAGLLIAVLVAMPAARLLPEYGSISVVSPVAGRWLGMNSPVDKVPSHGVRAYGQAYAIDLVYEPVGKKRPAFGEGPAMRSPEEYPAFGQPVRAMVDGEVVAVLDTLRDHRARSSMSGIVYMMIEGAIRELAGPKFIIGNHVTIRSDDGVFAVVAHIKNGSAFVNVGDRVRAGQEIAECGNSGNSSEPHVHAQLMDRRSAWTGQGVPFSFVDVRIGDTEQLQNALPGNLQHVTIDMPASVPARPAKPSKE
ncbi:M23 family metallopeptidase [Glutamicibacter mishrai]|uniref:M23 family metallopeptidase n=1 Tax=Glutamicibacter mishrai TaxID=1775880 RepID=UPI0020CD0A44|nr:M23 family metallopeptidase [Glutamicibacter mishrai]UTT38674.1 M23 family metallopeptidase [Glutamicibacter mishrai]